MKPGRICVASWFLFSICFLPIIASAQLQDLWEQQFPLTSGSVATRDTNGNTYVVGSASNANDVWPDVVALKYDANGTLLWSTECAGGTNEESAVNITVDPNGNAYVLTIVGLYSTGFPYPALVKLDPQGNVQWHVSASGPDTSGNPYHVRTDANGNVYTAYDDGMELMVVKFDANGTNLWRTTVPDPGSFGQSSDLQVDAAGFVYVTGTEMVTYKLDPQGNVLWQRPFGPTNSYNYSSELALDAAGNIYVTGAASDVDAGGYAIIFLATAKYNTNGKQLWAARYYGALPQDAEGEHLVVDDKGFVYVVGFADAISYFNQVNIVTLKYSPSGKQLWAARYPRQSDASTGGIALDTDRNVYVFGSSGDIVPIIKMDADGNRLWTFDCNSSSNAMTAPVGMFLDSSNGLYVVGNGSNSVVTAYFQQTNPLAGAPNILLPPHASTVSIGKNAKFKVKATGNGPLGYQWLFDGVPLNGETNSTLTLTDVGTNDAGAVSVEVSNSVSVTASPEAELNVPVHQTPTVEIHVTHPVVSAGETQNFPHLIITRNKVGSDSPLTVLLEFSGTAPIDDDYVVPDLRGSGQFGTLTASFGANQLTTEAEIQLTGLYSTGKKSENIRIQLKPSLQFHYHIASPAAVNVVIVRE